MDGFDYERDVFAHGAPHRLVTVVRSVCQQCGEAGPWRASMQAAAGTALFHRKHCAANREVPVHD